MKDEELVLEINASHSTVERSRDKAKLEIGRMNETVKVALNPFQVVKPMQVVSTNVMSSDVLDVFHIVSCWQIGKDLSVF